ncbi:MAG: DUF433 domain-containing protein [Acidobacteriota bacterium]
MTVDTATEAMPLQTDQDGSVRVGNTRVTIEILVGAFNDGFSPEEIVAQYPVLDLADVYAVIGYYLRHRSEIDAYVAERARGAMDIRRTIEASFPPHGIRERLLARRGDAPIGAIVDDLVIIAQCSREDEWENKVVRLPLTK